MQAPEWNRQDKEGSLEQWIGMLNTEARRQFLEDGTHVEIFFIFGDEGLLEVVPIAGMEKDEIVRELKKMLAERNGYAFIHISEGTMRHMDSADKADMLLVHAESRNGLGVAYCSTVALRGEEKLLLDAVKVDGQKLEGRFTNIFQDL
ncbi:hypothetical protein [Pontiella sulfatireligans]|uniref:Uncharacterized protein n=1 Tax=Pontiella sulfatireligans TaxID=2750658 RepID=A0A6C2UIB4_9BACT|nr:hypothetical protein [Pontiella sulfatireligans]VGO19197.1 hypothetical protein SCARR_01254 [Pontiella sulfatireligans]